ncbi:MAG: GFA family protein [Alphaproteobacteria bacterium]|jgi:hypothetical protein|nr:GFA family protein [Alphaproteobacteria bacterium]
MKLIGSCHCQSVRFEVESFTPYPFMYCYCSICRKTAGGGGYAINIMGQANTFKVEGREHVSIYRARMPGKMTGTFEESSGQRHFCKICASCLWISDPQWPDWVYPFASAIDTPLPKPLERIHMMLDFAAKWCEIPKGKKERYIAQYPEDSIEGWHKDHGVYGVEGKEE